MSTGPEKANYAAVATPATTLKRESDDDYLNVIARLDDANTRIIECPDCIQWIMQRRLGGRWRSVSFHRDRDVLIERSGATGPALAILQKLPATHS